MKCRMVVLGSVHPAAGLLLFEVIPDSQVGYADIYQLTDRFNCADFIEVKSPDWRQHEQTFDGKAWDKWVIDNHLSRINWLSNDAIRRICMKHGLSCSNLMEWANNTMIWEDIPVIFENVDGNCLISLCP